MVTRHYVTHKKIVHTVRNTSKVTRAQLVLILYAGQLLATLLLGCCVSKNVPTLEMCIFKGRGLFCSLLLQSIRTLVEIMSMFFYAPIHVTVSCFITKPLATAIEHNVHIKLTLSLYIFLCQ